MAPRSKEENKRVLDKRRNQILAAALKVFAEKGFAATKVSHIALEAGLSHGLLYHYFKTKNDIFTELIRTASNVFLAITEYGAKYDTSPIDKIRIITEMIISIGYSRRSAYHLNIFEQAYISEGIPDSARKIINDNLSSNITLIAEIIGEGQRLGQIIEGDPFKLAFAFYSMVRGMTGMQSKSVKFQDKPISFSDSDIIMRALKNPELKDENSVPQKINHIFSTRQIIKKNLKYRYRENDKTNFLTYEETVRETTVNGKKLLRIDLKMDKGLRMVAITDPVNWKPVKIEFIDGEGNSLHTTEYKNNSVFFKTPDHTFQKEIRLTGLYYDHNTLPYLLKTYPFESNKSIQMTLILDGSFGLPIGPYGVEIENLGIETINVPAGNYDCYKLELTPVGFDIMKIYYWFSVDEPRFMIKRDLFGMETELVEESI